MNRVRCALLGVASALGVLGGACSVIPRIEIANLTGAPIVLRIESSDIDRRATFDELVTIAPGRERSFRAGRVRGYRLPVKVGRCVYVYWLGDIPPEMLDYSGDTLSFDLKSDLALHVPPNKGTGPDPTPQATRTFPRHPMARSCT